MSIVAEFAAQLHELQADRTDRHYQPAECTGRVPALGDVRAVIFDVYGTLIDYWKPAFDAVQTKQYALLDAFGRTCVRFGLDPILSKMNPGEPPEKTLYDFYHGLISLHHQNARADTGPPEIRVEKIWQTILMMADRNGFDSARLGLGSAEETARCMAYYYNFYAIGRRLYPHVVTGLLALRDAGIRLGIVSNAQFYTPIDLTLLLRDQAGNTLDDYRELFDEDLTFFSFEYGVAKPGAYLFERLLLSLREAHILPAQAVFVGNDVRQDIQAAAAIGMATALFCGDRRSTLGRELLAEVTPDCAFTDFRRLPDMFTLHGERSPAP